MSDKDAFSYDELPPLELPKMSEALFVDVYLPILAEGPKQEFISRWVNEISKNPNLPVEVYNDSNELLFTVPPLFPEHDLRDSYEVEFVTTEANQKGNINRQLAEAHVKKHLPGFSEIHLTNRDHELKVWESILRRYGYDRVNAKVSESSDEPSNSSQEVEFEDWD